MSALWGFNFVVIKLGLGEFPPLFFAALRFIFVAFPAVFFIKRADIAWKWIIAVGLSIGVVKFGLLYIGMDAGMSAGLASLVLQVQVIFTTLLAVIVLKEKLEVGQLLGIGLCVLGMAFIGSDKTNGAQLLALILVITAGLAWAVGNIVIKLSNIADSFRLFVWIGLIPPVPLLLLSLRFEQGQLEALTQLSWLGVGAVLYTSLISTVLGFGLWAWLIHKNSPNAVVPFALLVPVFGLLSSVLVLGDTLKPNELYGTLIVLAGLALTILSKRLSKFVAAQVASSRS